VYSVRLSRFVGSHEYEHGAGLRGEDSLPVREVGTDQRDKVDEGDEGFARGKHCCVSHIYRVYDDDEACVKGRASVQMRFVEAYSVLSDAEYSARLAMAGSTSSLVGECCTTRTVFEMAILSIRRFLLLRFPSCIL
jgi:hypothetical protein